MKMYLISDNIDTYTGMRLAGVEGVVVHERAELKEALEHTIADKEVGIILLTEKFSSEFFGEKNDPYFSPKNSEENFLRSSTMSVCITKHL